MYEFDFVMMMLDDYFAWYLMQFLHSVDALLHFGLFLLWLVLVVSYLV